MKWHADIVSDGCKDVVLWYKGYMKYKLIAFDIDDTIVPNLSNEPSMQIREAIQKASEKVTVALVTARSRNEFQSMADALGCANAFHVVENGAKVINPQGELEYDLHIPETEIQQILDVTSPYFDEVGFCLDSEWHLEDAQWNNESVNGLSFSCYEYEKAYLLEQAIHSLPEKYNVFTGRHWDVYEWAGILVSHKDASKGKGLKYIQKKLGITKNETIAMGDAVPDLAMFEYAGLKVAMENGEQQVKDKADIIAPSVHKDGAVEIINKYILSSSQKK